jgi:hypothetical protein
VLTSPGAEVSITLQVTQQTSVLFRAVKEGTADSAGKLTKSIKITFHPTKKTKARITAEVQTAGGTAVNSVQITILPHA